MIRILVLTIAALFTATAANAQVVFDEAVDGDLTFTVSDPLIFLPVEPVTPATTFNISVPGTLTVTGTTIDADQDDIFAPGGIAGDFDVFGFNVAPGLQIDSVTLDAFGGGGQAFIGLVPGTLLGINPTVGPGNADFDTIASGLTLIDSGDIGEILDDLILGLDDGFGDNVPGIPLTGGVIGSGDFVFSVQNTGPGTNSYSLTFNTSSVPEPSSAALLSIAALGLAGFRRRK